MCTRFMLLPSGFQYLEVPPAVNPYTSTRVHSPEVSIVLISFTPPDGEPSGDLRCVYTYASTGCVVRVSPGELGAVKKKLVLERWCKFLFGSSGVGERRASES